MEQEIDKIQGGGPDEVETLQKDIVQLEQDLAAERVENWLKWKLKECQMQIQQLDEEDSDTVKQYKDQLQEELARL